MAMWIIRLINKVKGCVVRLLDIHEVDVNEIVIKQLISNISQDMVDNDLSFDQLRCVEYIVNAMNISENIDNKIAEFTEGLEYYVHNNIDE